MTPIDLNIAYLQNELQRIDFLIQKATLLWQMAGQNPEDRFRGLYVSAQEAISLSGRRVGQNWGSGLQLSRSDEKTLSDAQNKAIEKSKMIMEQAHQQQVRLRLHDLVTGFGLSSFEYNAFLVCLAPVVDLRYERLYGFLQDDVTRKSPNASLILDLLLPPGLERLPALEYLHERANLLKFRLLRRINGDINNGYREQGLSLLRQEFTPSPEIVAWLFGVYRPADEYAECFFISDPLDQSDKANNAQEFTSINNMLAFNADELEQVGELVSASAQPPLLAFYGADQQRQKAAALQIAAALDQPLLEINLEICRARDMLGPGVLRLGLRDAILNQAVPYFTGWDAWGVITGQPEQVNAHPGYLPGFVRDELESYSGLVIISGQYPLNRRSTAQITSSSYWMRPVLDWTFDLPSSQQRLELWKVYLAQQSAILVPDHEMIGDRSSRLSNTQAPLNSVSSPILESLAAQFTLSSLQIRDAVWTAVNNAFQRGDVVNAEDLFQAARQHSAHHLGELAVKLQPRYRWEDIILPEDEMSILHEITATIRERSLVLETWGLGRKLVSSAGVNALFAGPPGTGKTLAAQVIAAELGMDLYKVDLSTVVSKYIGETEKNLERIFTQARNSNTILFFDEADAIFGKRSEVKDAHDRYANIEVGYLLQRMESYDGVVILATNLRSNMDDAFIRRLQFVVNFPFPEKNERLNIWKVLMPSEMPRDEQIDFEMLAKRFELAGGSIRNVIVTAAFLAANEGERVSTRHLFHGVRREMQKMGRLINEKDLHYETT